MNPAQRINSPSIDIEAFFDGLTWDDAEEVTMNLSALTSGVELLKEAILANLVVPEAYDFKLLTRTMQDSDPSFKICRILEDLVANHTGVAVQFKEVAADLSLLREVISGLVKYASDGAGEKVRNSAFESFLGLLPKIHGSFVVTGNMLVRWKAGVMLEQQIDFAARLLNENEGLAEPSAVLAWGNGYLEEIVSDESEGSTKFEPIKEMEPLLADLKHHCLMLLQADEKREVETYEKIVELTPATKNRGVSGFSELIFRARKEAEKGATFHLTVEFEAFPEIEKKEENTGSAVPVPPAHLKRVFRTPHTKMSDIQSLIDGFATPLQEEVTNGDFKGQDSQSLTSWFKESFVPWIQSDDVVLIDG